MEYSKVQHSFARTATFKGADPASRGVWLSLHVYCGDQENGGIIRSCRTWTDRQWYAAIDATKPELEAAIAQGMARWEGNDLQMNSYDKIGEDAYKVARDENSYRAKCRWAKERGEPMPPRPVPRGTVPPVVPAASVIGAAGTTDPDTSGTAGGVPAAMPIPVQTIPVHSTHTPADAGGEGVCVKEPQPPREPTKEENTAALEKLLVRLTCATGPKATPLWAGLAMQAKVRSQAEALECVEWLIRYGRAQGKDVNFASDVLSYLPAWGWHQAEKRRKERDRQARSA